ncbi:hypothetical protein DPMN_018735 [Dreissena polymorpha]|uniref:Uncharacterized protein n=1 Tax=Dreissena polymorpha TaxID=45954 RepID=A0A9D4NH54_DREPO|nr:hypothetical protein DPMN_018735 [Dreissena polymorpha]
MIFLLLWNILLKVCSERVASDLPEQTLHDFLGQHYPHALSPIFQERGGTTTCCCCKCCCCFEWDTDRDGASPDAKVNKPKIGYVSKQLLLNGVNHRLLLRRQVHIISEQHIEVSHNYRKSLNACSICCIMTNLFHFSNSSGTSCLCPALNGTKVGLIKALLFEVLL